MGPSAMGGESAAVAARTLCWVDLWGIIPPLFKEQGLFPGWGRMAFLSHWN